MVIHFLIGEKNLDFTNSWDIIGTHSAYKGNDGLLMGCLSLLIIGNDGLLIYTIIINMK